MSENTSEIVDEIFHILRKHKEMMSRVELERILAKNFANDEVHRTIESSLDSMVLIQLLDKAPQSSDLDWYLKIPEEKRHEQLKSLNKDEFALIRVLQKQNKSSTHGYMMIESAKKELKKQGFVSLELDSICITDFVDSYFISDDNGDTQWCRLIPEYEKDRKYREREDAAHERRQSRRDAMEMNQISDDDLENP